MDGVAPQAGVDAALKLVWPLLWWNVRRNDVPSKLPRAKHTVKLFDSNLARVVLCANVIQNEQRAVSQIFDDAEAVTLAILESVHNLCPINKASGRGFKLPTARIWSGFEQELDVALPAKNAARD